MSGSKDIAVLILDIQKNFECENLWNPTTKKLQPPPAVQFLVPLRAYIGPEADCFH